VDATDLDYDLPSQLIAQTPVEPRDSSRLLVHRLETGRIEHRIFSELPELLGGELVVVNDTRVVPGRLRLRRSTGGSVEVLLVEERGEGVWEALVRIPPGRVASYEEIAARIDAPGAVRAVGNALARNPVAFLIPCHRVIRKTGAFGNYRWGPARKKAILAWEAATSGRGSLKR